MKLLIVDTNFYNDKDWIFKLTDDDNSIYYILDTTFYKDLGIETPISKKHLDSYDKGRIINAEVDELSGRNIVTLISD